METYTLELDPSKQVHIALFESVTNANELNVRSESRECTFINAQLVINKFHVLLAANRAVCDASNDKLKTRNVHSEVLFNIGGSNNFDKTYRTFGIQSDTTQVVAVKIGGSKIDAEAHMKEHVKGVLVSFDNLAGVTDLALIEKVYHLGNQKQDENAIMSLVAGEIALRGHQ